MHVRSVEFLAFCPLTGRGDWWHWPFTLIVQREGTRLPLVHDFLEQTAEDLTTVNMEAVH